jgi:hypothetical protein
MFYSQIIYGDTVLYKNPACKDSYELTALLSSECKALQEVFPYLFKIYVEQYEDDDILPKISALREYDDLEGYEGEVPAEELTALQNSARKLIKRRDWGSITPPFAEKFGISIKEEGEGYAATDGKDINYVYRSMPSPIEIKKIVVETYGQTIVNLLVRPFGEGA